jgi:hypothetical protein
MEYSLWSNAVLAVLDGQRCKYCNAAAGAAAAPAVAAQPVPAAAASITGSSHAADANGALRQPPAKRRRLAQPQY